MSHLLLLGCLLNVIYVSSFVVGVFVKQDVIYVSSFVVGVFVKQDVIYVSPFVVGVVLSTTSFCPRIFVVVAFFVGAITNQDVNVAYLCH